MQDQYPNAKAIDDGLSWQPDPEIDWHSIPHRVEERANWQKSASSLCLDYAVKPSPSPASQPN